MADKPADQPTMVVESESQRASRALAQAAEDAAERKADTLEVDPNLKVDGKPMESGGRFVVEGVLVDSNGRAIEGKPSRARASD